MNNRASGMVQIGINRLAADYPFHSALLAQWKVIEDSSVDTVGVGFRQGGLALLYSPSFVETLTMDELEGVLHHEANHCLFGHLLHTPAEGEDEAARMVAEEVTCNEWVPEPLPGDPIVLKDYPVLEPNQDTNTRYELLRGKVRTPPHTLDSHACREELQASSDLAEKAIASCMASAWAGLDATAKDKVQPLFSALGEQAGAESGMAEAIMGGGRARLPWTTLLRRYVGKVMVRRPVFGLPPRRYPHLAGIIPGKCRTPAKLRVMAVIDTSGSLSDAMLAHISRELGTMARTCAVTVVECDQEILAVYRYHPITSVHGRGGTDLRPPFERVFLAQHKPDILIYLTDGYGKAPKTPPPIPVIWCLTEGGKRPAAWGQVVWMLPH